MLRGIFIALYWDRRKISNNNLSFQHKKLKKDQIESKSGKKTIVKLKGKITNIENGSVEKISETKSFSLKRSIK